VIWTLCKVKNLILTFWFNFLSYINVGRVYSKKNEVCNLGKYALKSRPRLRVTQSNLQSNDQGQSAWSPGLLCHFIAQYPLPQPSLVLVDFCPQHWMRNTRSWNAKVSQFSSWRLKSFLRPPFHHRQATCHYRHKDKTSTSDCYLCQISLGHTLPMSLDNLRFFCTGDHLPEVLITYSFGYHLS